MADLKEVVLRLERLEQTVGAIAVAPKVATVTAEEVAAYHKVNNLMWEDGTCGINETSPCIFRCNVFSQGRLTRIPQELIPRPCINECTCGPCSYYTPAYAGMARFAALGR